MTMRLLLVLSLSLSCFAWAEPQAPTCNPTDEDTALFQGQTARQFFATRTEKNSTCVAKYEAAKTAFLDARATLVKLVADKAPATQIDTQENKVESLRQPYLEATAECGPCVANPIGEPTEVPADGHTQIWYKSDGSCQLPTTDKAELSRAFDNLTHDLTHLKAYIRQPATGKGYNAIIDVEAYDPSNGHLNPQVDGFDGAGSSLFISVKGPLGTAFSYYFYDKFQFSEKDGVRQFTMHGDAVKPQGFQPPRLVSYTTASGKKKHAVNSMLTPGSQTTWYVNEDGYVRYCATADFGIKSQFVQNFGRTLMLDLLATSVEKAQ